MPASRAVHSSPPSTPTATPTTRRCCPSDSALTKVSWSYSGGRWNDESGFSKGTRTDDTTEISFRSGTGFSEYLGWMLIPKETAFAAAQEFFRTAQQPTCVEWGDL
jgi:hypothetical protein